MAKIVTFKNNLEYYMRLYDTRIQDNDLLGALDACRSAFSHARTRIQRDAICLLIGQIYFDMELYSLSCDYYFRAVSIPSTRASAYMGVARNLFMLNKFALAVEYLDRVLEWDYLDKYTQDVLYWNNSIKQKLSNLQNDSTIRKLKTNINNLTRLGKYAELDAYLIELCQIYPLDCDFAILNAKNKIYLKDYNNARKILFDLLSAFPNYPPALVLLSRLCIILQDHNTCREYLSNLANNNDLDTDTLLSIGGLYFELNDYHNAIRNFEQVLRTHPYRPKLLLFTAISYFNIQDYKNALYYIGQARWIDFDNPVLKQFYQIFKLAEYPNSIPLSNSIPLEIAQQKIEHLLKMLDSGEFHKYFYDHADATDDIEWCMSLERNLITDKLSANLTKLKNKKATNLINKILLSSHYSLYSKFCITKNAFISGNYKYLDLNSHYVFRSFRTIIPNKYKKNPCLTRAIANARAYVECYATKIDINSELHFISDLVLNNNKLELDEFTLTCSFFYQYHTVLNDVCAYFDVPIHSIHSALNQLGVR